MNSNYPNFADDYLLSTRSVLLAGRRLRTTIGEKGSRLEYAKKQLEVAVNRYDKDGTDYRSFMFSDLNNESEIDKEMLEHKAEDTLATILSDFQVANILFAAGYALEETGKGYESPDPCYLDEAIRRLEDTVRAIEPSLSPQDAGISQPKRFGFSQIDSVSREVKSQDLSSAIEGFRNQSEATIKALVNEAHGAIISALPELKKIGENKVLEVLSELDNPAKWLGSFGRFFRFGAKKLRDAIEALMRFLGTETMSHMRTHLEKIWRDYTQGKLIKNSLELAFKTEEAHAQIEDILNLKNLDIKELDDARSALLNLEMAFNENMAMIRAISAALLLAGTILKFAPLAGPETAAFIAFAYTVTLGAVVFIGMDYADSENIVRRVHGIREIAQGLINKK
jgi:hypothetical protein